MEKDKILERLQFIADSGWDIKKGALAAKTLIVSRNGINGDIEIAPVFDEFHNEIELRYNCLNRKIPSPVGDLRDLLQDNYQTRFNLNPYAATNEDKFRGEYLVFRKRDPHNDHMEAVQRKGFRFEYNWGKRLFTPAKN